MGHKSKFFRCFVEGNTISDGRKVTAQHIDQIVETFNRETYTPRINVEHFRGFSPEPPFNGYGDVIAVRAQDDAITIDGKTEQRRALYAQVEGNDQLVALGAADQKPFPSVELTDSYAGTGKVGLIGLAFTDSPASIATQRLHFARSAPGTVRAAGDDAVALAFETAPADTGKVESAVAGFFAALTARFRTSEPANAKDEPRPAANDNFDPGAFTTELQSAVTGAITAVLQPVIDAQARFRTDLDALTTTLAETPDDGFRRAPATGGTGVLLTDF